MVLYEQMRVIDRCCLVIYALWMFHNGWLTSIGCDRLVGNELVEQVVITRFG